MSLYRGEIAYADRELGLFRDELAARGLLDDGLLVVTSDHGEQFGEHGQFGHGLTLFQEELAVPLILFAPGRVEPGVINAPASLLDLAATLAGLVQNASGSATGVDLLGSSIPEGRELIADLRLAGLAWTALRQDSWKLLDDGGDRLPFLFDLDTDPGETSDLFASTRRARPMRRRLRTLLEALESTALRETEINAPIDEKALEQLRALGYIQ